MRENWIALCVLALLIAIAFGNVIFFGKSLIPSDNQNPLDPRYSSANYGPSFVPLEQWTRRGLSPRTNYRDPAASVLQGEPAAEVLRRSLARRELPLWDPYTGGGTPSMSTLVPAYFFPPSLAVVLLGNGSGIRNAYILLLLLGAAFATYRLLRVHDAGLAASLGGAIAVLFCGALIQTVPTFLGQPVACMPLALLVTSWFLARPGARRGAVLALTYAGISLASFPAILLQLFGFCVVYAIVSVCINRDFRTIGRFAAASVCGAAIAGAYYVPSAYAALGSPHVFESYVNAGLGRLEPVQLLQLLSPSILGGSEIFLNPVTPSFRSAYLFHTGVAGLWLGVVGALAPAATRRQRILKTSAVIVTLGALAKVFGVPVIHSIGALPFFRTFHYDTYFGIVIAFGVALLAGLGIDSLRERRGRATHAVVATLVVAAALIGAYVVAVRSSLYLYPERWRWLAEHRLLAIFALIVVGAAVRMMTSPRRRALAAGVVIAVVAVEGITHAAYPRQRRWNVWRHPPAYVRAIDAAGAGGRLLLIGRYSANMPSVFRQATLDSLTVFTSPRMYDLYRRYFGPRTDQFMRWNQHIPPEPVLDAANVEIVVAPPAHGEAALRGYASIFEDEYVRLHRRHTEPRYFFTSSYRVTDARSARELLASARPARQVLLEHQPRFPSTPNAPADPLPVVRTFGMNEVELLIDAPRAGFLYCSESKMDGWRAAIDGDPAAIVAANYAFRAIELPPGRHRVHLRYRPPGLTAGLALTFAGLTVCGIALRRGRRTNGDV